MSDEELRLADYLGHILEAVERIADYTGDMEIVWRAVERDIPELGQQMRELLEQAAR